jgi:drug/metabolite transporter (DMT)-like permease
LVISPLQLQDYSEKCIGTVLVIGVSIAAQQHECNLRKEFAMTASIACPAAADETRGMLLGLVGVAMFSLTIPFTRIAVAELDPIFVALGRALGAAALAGAWLVWQRASLPKVSALLPLGLVAGGCIVGFPLFSSIALRSVPSAHAAILAGILPLATALYSALRGFDRPSPGFWAMAALGSGIVVAFALAQGGGHFQPADLLMFFAVACAAVGYAEGGRLSRAMGGQQVICWALVLAAPLLAPLLIWLNGPHLGELGGVGLRSWVAFGYVTVFSMFIGFFFWYGGLAKGGVARVGQVQLLQPFLSLVGAALLLDERLTLLNCAFALAVVAVVFAGRKMQVRR